MKVIKKYKLVEVDINNINGDRIISLEIPREDIYSLYDSEEEAIEAAHKKNSWSEWTIIPIIKFDNY